MTNNSTRETVSLDLADAWAAYLVALSTTTPQKPIFSTNSYHDLREILARKIASRTKIDEDQAALCVDEYLEEIRDPSNLTDIAGGLDAVIDKLRRRKSTDH
jgi:hypothetical protein